ncbi:hypothetical protein [Nocardia rhamnosiphila]|uniref:Uncharacterized protein n=1 Tax=Nocardia rhamnosiphila TaxID=426716 RepID=A0ABV2WYT4_9NOCA
MPVRLIGRQVRVLLHASTWWSSTAAPKSPATNACSTRSRLDLDHYLEALLRNPVRCPARPHWNKPAPPGSSPRSTKPGGLRTAERTATETALALIEVLLLHRHLPTTMSSPAARPRQQAPER